LDNGYVRRSGIQEPKRQTANYTEPWSELGAH
jgi:hypothetical protein